MDNEVAKEIRSFKRWFIIMALIFLVPYLVTMGLVSYSSYTAYNAVQDLEIPKLNAEISNTLNTNLNEFINSAINNALSGKTR